MKTFYKIICKECNNIIEKCKSEVEHATITMEGKSCPLCKCKELKLWRSMDNVQVKTI